MGGARGPESPRSRNYGELLTLVVALLVEVPSARELLEDEWEEEELTPPSPVLDMLEHGVLVLLVLLDVVFVGRRLLVERPVLVAFVEELLTLGSPAIDEPVLRLLVELLTEDPIDELVLFSRCELLDELVEDLVDEQDVVLEKEERLNADTDAELVEVVLVFPELLVAAA